MFLHASLVPGDGFDLVTPSYVSPYLSDFNGPPFLSFFLFLSSVRQITLQRACVLKAQRPLTPWVAH